MELSEDLIPAEIAVAPDRRAMRVEWPSGRVANLSATRLRAACRCAWCTRDRILDRFPIETATVALDAARALGSHGLHLEFSDGHARGIYPWRYLDELSRDECGAAPRTPRCQTTQDQCA